MTRQTIGFVLALSVFVILLLLPTFATFHDMASRLISEQHSSMDAVGLAMSMHCVFALTLLVIILWLTEAVPLPAAALLPAVVIPLFHIHGLQRGAMIELNFASTVAN